jgi:hypothetical protein
LWHQSILGQQNDAMGSWRAYEQCCFFVLLTAAGYIAMGLMAPNAFHSIYFLGFLACLILGCAFLGLPVWHATSVGLIAGLIYIDGLRVFTGE